MSPTSKAELIFSHPDQTSSQVSEESTEPAVYTDLFSAEND